MNGPKSFLLCCLLVIVLLVVIIISFAILGPQSEYKNRNYLYYGVMEQKEYYPISEYLAPSNRKIADDIAKFGSSADDNFFLTLSANSDIKINTTSNNNINSNVHRIVEFYAPWCPHCRHFKPKYIEFARKMKKIVAEEGIGNFDGNKTSTTGGDDRDDDNNNKIEFYAVSCVANKKLCTANSINGIPTIRLYPAGSNIIEEAITLSASRLNPLNVIQILKEYSIEKNKNKSGTIKGFESSMFSGIFTASKNNIVLSKLLNIIPVWVVLLFSLIVLYIRKNFYNRKKKKGSSKAR